MIVQYMCRIMSDFLLVEALVVVARAWVARSCDVQVQDVTSVAWDFMCELPARPILPHMLLM